MTIQHTTFLGQPAVQIENEKLSATVAPELGGKLVSIVDKQTQTKLLRQPESLEQHTGRPVLYGDPILFPPNRIADGRFTYQGQVYQLEVNKPKEHNHSHGFLHVRAWKLDKVDEAAPAVEVRFDSQDYPDVEQQWRHRFTVRIRYELNGEEVIKRAFIENHSDSDLPYGFGYHTTFRFPFGEHSRLEDCTLTVPVSKHWLINDRNLPTGQMDDEYVTSLQRGMVLQGKAMDDEFLASDAGSHAAVLHDAAAGLEVTYASDEHFTQWVVYNGDGQQGFLCPEPYTWVTNAPNLNLPPEVTGLRAVAPKETHELFCKITVRHR